MGVVAKIWAAPCLILHSMGVAFIITGILMHIQGWQKSATNDTNCNRLQYTIISRGEKAVKLS